jgi:hypothetical protein
MTRRPQNIKRGDEVFAAFESTTANWIVGGVVEGFGDTRGIIVEESGSVKVRIRVSKLYSVTYKTYMALSLRNNSSDLPSRILVPRSQVRHINDVRFLQ